ncbi:MAG: hypothetical protein IJQ79_05695, partial [Bacteroidales bacterium]|nr:hypothetical protein [Bacteroidales bacterium]
MVSVPEKGRDCWFPGISSGLGAGGGTRLLVSGDSARSRCRRWDETAGFEDFAWSRCQRWDETAGFR